MMTTLNAFEKWFMNAAPGDAFTYRRAAATIVHRTALIDRVWALACAGLVDLVQRREAGFIYEYVAIKRRRPDPAPVTPRTHGAHAYLSPGALA